jgi:hypothetical protein
MDNWNHRSQGMRCRTCIFFVKKHQEAAKTSKTMVSCADPAGYDVPALRGELGRCRRHAPTMNGFPAVFCKDWCGDHKLDENKI